MSKLFFFLVLLLLFFLTNFMYDSYQGLFNPKM